MEQLRSAETLSAWKPNTRCCVTETSAALQLQTLFHETPTAGDMNVQSLYLYKCFSPLRCYANHDRPYLPGSTGDLAVLSAHIYGNEVSHRSQIYP
ncbi:hypothetical protein FQA47_021297 [Oryzias melastigma]|uniref:Uncharacterized protein n=1 Tax=Oryzias melastigma TaxID=30732 RepID=A0A834CES4_ORYME|nr:hypothetical protein FQA47_021297 [Oryzias melastigma]